MTMPANSRADFPREQPPQPNPIRLAHSKALRGLFYQLLKKGIE